MRGRNAAHFRRALSHGPWRGERLFIGLKAGVMAAMVIANTAVQLMRNPATLAPANAELVRARRELRLPFDCSAIEQLR